MKLAETLYDGRAQIYTANGNLKQEPIEYVRFYDGSFSVNQTFFSKNTARDGKRRVSSSRAIDHLTLRALGLSNQQVGLVTCQDAETVKTNTANVRRALKAANNNSAILPAIFTGLYTIDGIGSAENAPINTSRIRQTRRTDVVDQIARGWNDQQTGENLGITAATVKSHRSNILENLGLGGAASFSAVIMIGVMTGQLDYNTAPELVSSGAPDGAAIESLFAHQPQPLRLAS
jgi:DNA-binding NarL/FixJ family response regulator